MKQSHKMAKHWTEDVKLKCSCGKEVPLSKYSSTAQCDCGKMFYLQVDGTISESRREDGETEGKQMHQSHKKHSEKVLGKTPPVPCQAQHRTFGGRCLNCGWEPKDVNLKCPCGQEVPLSKYSSIAQCDCGKMFYLRVDGTISELVKTKARLVPKDG